MSRLLLGLDLSTNVGWCLMKRGAHPTFGTLRLPPAFEDSHVRRFSALHDWLHDSRQVMGFEALAYEQPILPRKSGDLATTMDTLTLLWGLVTVVQLYAGQVGLPCKGIAVQTAKRTLTGNPNATKEQMVAAAMNDMSWPVADDHQADAGAVAWTAYEQIWPKARAA